MANEREREILSELMELYRNLPCLWDIGSDPYKDTKRKAQAWDEMVKTMKKMDSEANVASVKRKVEHMRSAYKRELKKIEQSKNVAGSGSSKEVHVPNLWYFKLMRFLDEKQEQHRSGVNMFIEYDEESSESAPPPPSPPPAPSSSEEEEEEEHSQTEIRKPDRHRRRRRRGRSECALDRKQRKCIEAAAQDPLELEPAASSSFGVYVGEQLQQVSTFQRQVAEKLISEVIFLAKTENLNFDSKVETLSRSKLSKYSHTRSPEYARYPNKAPVPSSRLNIEPSPSRRRTQRMQPSSSPRHVQQIPPKNSSAEILNTVHSEGCESLLKELLIYKSE